MALIKPGVRAKFIDGLIVQLNGRKSHGSGAKRLGAQVQIVLLMPPEQKAAPMASL